MQNPLVLKLKRFAALSEAEIDAVSGLSGQKLGVDAGRDVIRQGDKPATVALILEGLACRYKLTEAGERQIVGIMVPGDLCDLHAFLLDKMDHSIAALTNLTLTYISREKLVHLFDTEPRITRALWWGTLVDESTLREWLMNVATRSSYERLAHLLSELCMRLETVGLATPEGCDIHIRQADLADAVGLGRQHVNSSLAKLQEEGLIDLRRGSIRVLDVNGLRAAGQFNQHYLHLQNL
ncbi:Crp/Fnr family transcriptional regulator [Bradyrhizobium diazoefficiens]|nr:Crp/Fnr family transcriptional regulator [Bradyrhizobium diazoefficiens]QQN66383.1 Crp/Fnr family transcriptional regulator [Bradyrhizobium diazoefficiens]